MSNEVCTYNGFMIIASAGGVGTVSEVPATYAASVLTITPAVVLEGTLTCESSVTMEGAVVIASTNGIDIGDGTASDFDLITVLDDVGDAMLSWDDSDKSFLLNKRLNWDVSADNTVFRIESNTDDGSDTTRFRISSGGGPSVIRGAYFTGKGNEFDDGPGNLEFAAGYGGTIYFYAQASGNKTERMRIQPTGEIVVPAANGIDIGDGTASDFDLITIANLAGGSKIWWDESAAGFVFSNKIVFTSIDVDAYIKLATADGSDNGRLRIAAGGDGSVTRGAYMHMHGNEQVDHPGNFSVFAGYGGDIAFYAQPSGAVTQRMRIDPTGEIVFPAAAEEYLGEPDAEGSWRFTRSGNDVVWQRYESSVWVEKWRLTA